MVTSEMVSAGCPEIGKKFSSSGKLGLGPNPLPSSAMDHTTILGFPGPHGENGWEKRKPAKHSGPSNHTPHTDRMSSA